MPFIFPRGVRFPTAVEFPSSPQKDEILKQIAFTRIEEGYTLKESKDPLFDLYAEINVSSEKIWSLFSELATAILPIYSTPLWGLVDEKLCSGRSQPVISVIQKLETKAESISHDCFFQFGLLSHTEEMLEEIMITPTKHFQVWTSQEDTLSAILAKFGIQKTDALQFIDEFPRVSVALSDLEHHSDLIEYFEKSFT